MYVHFIHSLIRIFCVQNWCSVQYSAVCAVVHPKKCEIRCVQTYVLKACMLRNQYQTIDFLFWTSFVKDDKDNVNDVGVVRQIQTPGCVSHARTSTHATYDETMAMVPFGYANVVYLFFSLFSCPFSHGDVQASSTVRWVIMATPPIGWEQHSQRRCVCVCVCERKAHVTTNAASYDVISFIKS